MDLIKKYLDLAEAWPGTPEYKKKHDPSYNPYDPEGKVRKALKLQPYGYRGKAADGDEEETPAATPSVAKRGRPKKKVAEAVSQNPSAEKTYNYAFDKVRAMDAKNPFKTDDKKRMYTKAAKGAFQRMKTPSKKPMLPEEVEQLSELDKEPGGTLHRYLAKAGGAEGRQRRIKAAMDNPQKLKKINTGIKSAETKIEKERQKQTGMNPQYQRTPTAREIQMMDTRYTHEEYESMPASKALQKAHDDERKKRGLPDPKYYLDLAAKKKKEIEDMKKEEVQKKETPPFTPDKPKKPSALAGKYGAGYSTARHLARMGIKAALKDLKKGPEAGKKQVS